MATNLAPSTHQTSQPTLRTGDRMTRAEFHRIYEQWPEHCKAELIEGVVYVGDLTKGDTHGWPHALVTGWAFVYATRRRNVRVYTTSTIVLNDENEPEPDICLRRLDGPPGSLQTNAAGFLEGVPEFVFEISATSAQRDLAPKLRVYDAAGVAEYVVWLVLERRVRWHRLVNGQYQIIEPDSAGMIESAAFPGLRLDIAALIEEDAERLLAALN